MGSAKHSEGYTAWDLPNDGNGKSLSLAQQGEAGTNRALEYAALGVTRKGRSLRTDRL